MGTTSAGEPPARMPPSVETTRPASMDVPPHMCSPARSPTSLSKRKSPARAESLQLLEKMQAEALAHTRVEVSKTLDIDPGAREAESPKPKKKVFKVVDGIEFETESAHRRHLYQTQYSFIDREGETLIRRPGDI